MTDSPVWNMSSGQVTGKLFSFCMQFITHSQAFTATCPACCQYSATIGSAHALTETMLIFASAIRGLEGSFHRYFLFLGLFPKTVGKGNNQIQSAK